MKKTVLFALSSLLVLSCSQQKSDSNLEIQVKNKYEPEHRVQFAFESQVRFENNLNSFAQEVRFSLFQASKADFFSTSKNFLPQFRFNSSALRENAIISAVNEQLERTNNYIYSAQSKQDKIDLDILKSYLVDQKRLREIKLSENRVELEANLNTVFYYMNSIEEIEDIEVRKKVGAQFIKDLHSSEYFYKLTEKLIELSVNKKVKISEVDMDYISKLPVEDYAMYLYSKLMEYTTIDTFELLEELKQQYKISVQKIQNMANIENKFEVVSKVSKEEYQALLSIHGVYADADDMYAEAKQRLSEELAKFEVLISKAKRKLNLTHLNKSDFFEHIRDNHLIQTNIELKDEVDRINAQISELIESQKIITQSEKPSLALFAGLEEGEAGEILRKRSEHGIPQMLRSLPPYYEEPFALWADVEVMKVKTKDFIVKKAVHSITAHEGRPGHEMQFRTIQESEDKSIIRHSIIQNTGNTEGWALFAESLIEKHIDPRDIETILYYKQAYLMRVLRVVTDYEINMGLISKEAGIKKYQEVMGVGRSTALSEITRRIESPGRDTGYYMGRTALESLRSDLKRDYSNYTDLCFNDLVLKFSFAPAKYVKELIKSTQNCLVE